MNKDRLIDFFKGSIIMLIIPIIGFYLIELIVPLEPVIYVITAFGCFYTIIISMTLEVMARERSWKTLGYSIAIMLVFPIVAFFAFALLTPIPLTTKMFAGAGFGALFGASVGVGFKLMLPRRIVSANQHNTCFALANNNCEIFRKECQHLENANNCIFYLSGDVAPSHRLEAYLPIANMLGQARAIKSQQRFNLYIIILSTIAIIIAIVSLIISIT